MFSASAAHRANQSLASVTNVLAVVVVREGVLPAGADEAVAECQGRGLVVGSGTSAAAVALQGIAVALTTVELGAFRPAAWSAALRPLLANEPWLVLPASPDGRDLAPHLAETLRRPALLNASQISPEQVTLVRRGGQDMHTLLSPPSSFVATLLTGLRGTERSIEAAPEITVVHLELDDRRNLDADFEAVLPPDAATIDLAEAERIIGGGAGLDAHDRFAQLAQLGARIGASIGATRVITDRHWIEHERQIGTTGVVVDPALYIAFGISGAVQHTSGLGDPDHIISINTDAHCPMMQMADLAVVADANQVLDHLLTILEGTHE